jgi:hypothetical protein
MKLERFGTKFVTLNPANIPVGLCLSDYGQLLQQFGVGKIFLFANIHKKLGIAFTLLVN